MSAEHEASERRPATEPGSPPLRLPLPDRVRSCHLRRLVVGGGHNPAFPRLRPCDVSLNLDPADQPDMLADVARIPLPDGAVDSVYFEHMPFPAFVRDDMQGLKEAVRVLRPGGRLRIRTGHAAPAQAIASELRRLHCVGVVVNPSRHGPLIITARRSLRALTS